MGSATAVFSVKLLTESELKDGDSVNDLNPGRGRGLGVGEGVGRSLFATATRLGANDNGRRFNVAGLGRDGAGTGEEGEKVTVTGDTMASTTGAGCEGRTSVVFSSSSSSSSMRVPSCSLDGGKDMNFPKESRLLGANVFRPL